MYKTSKSPRKVLLAAHAVAKDALPQYSHRFSPQKFTQHQLFAILVLKEHQRSDYRKIAALLQDTPELCAAIELEEVPHFTALQKASSRLLKLQAVHQLLLATVAQAKKEGC